MLPQCWTFGRPPSFYLSHIDCKLPSSGEPGDESCVLHDTLIYPLSDYILVDHAWKHRFASECMSIVHDQAFGAKTPTYATVLQLDRKLRAFPVPPNLQVAGFGNSSPPESRHQESVSLILQRHIVLAIREMSMSRPFIHFFLTPAHFHAHYSHVVWAAADTASIRSSLSPPEFLCSCRDRSPQGPTGQSIWNFGHRCLPQCRFTCRLDAESSYTTQRAK